MLTELERRALKSVVGLAVKTAGGQENAVNVTSRISRHVAFSEYANPEIGDRHCPIDVAVELDQFNATPLILKAMARMTGHELIALPRVVGDDSPLGQISGAALKEVGEVFATLGKQLEDGKISRLEDQALNREIDEAVEKLLTLKLVAHAMVERKART